MNKQKLKDICDSTSKKIIENEYSEEQLIKKLSQYSVDGKSISPTGQIAFCMFETQQFVKSLVYEVLCEVLDVKE
jgi:hypothetical protein